MYALVNLGGFVEKTWGRWRMLVIYFVSAWIGSCVAMINPPGVPLVGASGAICGLLGALAVWVVLYGRHLPRDMAGRMRRAIIINIVSPTILEEPTAAAATETAATEPEVIKKGKVEEGEEGAAAPAGGAKPAAAAGAKPAEAKKPEGK